MKINKQIAKECSITVDELEFSDMVDEMSTEERIEFRAILEKSKVALPRNLYFDYDLQVWF